MNIAPEQASDISAVRDVHLAAFPTQLEADLVDALRTNGHAVVSLVARLDDRIVGHIAFSPVTIDGAHGLGLAPVAVLPAYQTRGVGAALVRSGLTACRALGTPFVVVLGAPAYYGRFGFTRASDAGIANEYGVDDEFMVLALVGELRRGVARYGDEFRVA